MKMAGYNFIFVLASAIFLASFAYAGDKKGGSMETKFP